MRQYQRVVGVSYAHPDHEAVPSDLLVTMQILARLRQFELATESQLAHIIDALDTLTALLRSAEGGPRAPHQLMVAPALSPYEVQLLAAIGQGATIRQLSHSFHRHKSTIDRDIANLCMKCDVSNRSQLIVWGTLHRYCELSDTTVSDE